MGKLRHTAIGNPVGKALFGPINQLLAIKPNHIHWVRCPVVTQAFRDWQYLIHKALTEPTHTKELIYGTPDYKGTLDASGKGVGVIWIPLGKEMVPIVWARS